jgi:mRNA interferase RelE/StbE
VSYAVTFARSVEKRLARLPAKVQASIMTRIRALATDPHPRGARPLTGDLRGRLKLRVGDYRIIYTVDRDALVVRVVWVGHRGRAYGEARRKG